MTERKIKCKTTAFSVVFVTIATVIFFLLLLQHNVSAFAFVDTSSSTPAATTIASLPYTTCLPPLRLSPQRPRPLGSALFDNNNNDFGGDDNINEDSSWQIALQQRQLSFQQQRAEIRNRWLVADCQQTVVGLPDWVRRVDVQWPLAACGSASGDCFVVHCESGSIWHGQSKDDQRRYADVPIEDKNLATALRQLFGDFDGGGTLAIALSWNNIVAHAGRTGGIELWKMDTTTATASDSEKSDKNTLISQGTILEDGLVTSLVWAEDDLWIGTQDGRVLVYTFFDGEDDDELPSEPAQEWKGLGGGTILSLSYHGGLDVAVATTSTGFVELLTLDEPECRRSFFPPFDSGRMASNAFPLCAAIVEEVAQNKKFAIACGGNDGSLFLQPLRLLDDGIDPELDLDRPFADFPARNLVPSHRGPCKCLVSPVPGILLSGGQDGTVRVWDLNAEDDKSTGLYLLSGFKVWLGSLWSDGERLVTDGSDNAIKILNFGEGDDE